MSFEKAIVGGTAVLPGLGEVKADIAISGGRIVAIGESLDADEVIDATGMLVLPGAVDVHTHLGIYRSMADDAFSETQSSLAGGVTSLLSYFRTGSHYLEKNGPYAEVLPEAKAEVANRAHADYGFHLAPMSREQVGEIESLVNNHGILSFKYYMFYKGIDLAGDGRGQDAHQSEVYDLGHLYEIMEAVTAVGESLDSRVSLSIHAEQPELIRLFMERVRKEAKLARRRGRDVVLGELKASQAVRELDLTEIPAASGLYLVVEKGDKRKLYAGSTLNLRERFERQFAAAVLPAWSVYSPPKDLQVRVLMTEGTPVELLAGQSVLVRQFQPQMNFADLAAEPNAVATP